MIKKENPSANREEKIYGLMVELKYEDYIRLTCEEEEVDLSIITKFTADLLYPNWIYNALPLLRSSALERHFVKYLNKFKGEEFMNCVKNQNLLRIQRYQC